MGSVRERVDKDGKTRYIALYRDLRGRQRSAGTFPTMRQADKAWQRAEALVESGKLGDPRRGRQSFAHYVHQTWLPAHQIDAGFGEALPAMIRILGPRTRMPSRLRGGGVERATRSSLRAEVAFDGAAAREPRRAPPRSSGPRAVG